MELKSSVSTSFPLLKISKLDLLTFYPGSPTTVADELQRWIDVADVDGFNLSYATIPGTFEDIIEHLIPELRRRGVLQREYAVPGGTLRENLGLGGPRLSESHYGSQFKWRAGEDVPAYLRSSGETEKS